MMKKSSFSTISRNLSLLVFLVLLASPFGSSVWCHEPVNVDEKFERGQTLFEAGDLLQAAIVLEEVVASQSKNQKARTMLFACYRFMGIEYYGQSHYEDALASWRKGLTMDPQNKEIQSFMSRCEAEMKALSRISGDTSWANDIAPTPELSVLVHTDSDSLPQSSVVDRDTTSAEKSVTMTCRHMIKFGLSYGMAFGTGDSRELNNGMTFMGSVSYQPNDHWLGARFDGTYTRFYKNSSDATQGPRHLAIFGFNINTIISMKVTHPASLDFSAGLGGYEIILTEPLDGNPSSISQRSYVIGLNMGLSWRKNMGDIAITVGAEYKYYYSSLSPNLLGISIGIMIK